MNEWTGKWAVVTGASAGIGVALAEELAAGGTHLVMTARRLDRLEEVAARLRSKHRVNVEVVAADLNAAEGPEEVFGFTERRGISVELLINNAGFGAYGEFYRNDRERELGMVRVNCLSVVHLTHLFLPAMVERRSGAILILASTAAFQAVAYIATYAATKAFDLLFAEALAEEVKRYGVKVCALCPGPTTSEFQDVAGTPARAGARFENAAKVARVGLKALAAGEHSVISGFVNQLGVVLQRLAPRRLVTGGAEKMLRPKHLK